MPAPTTPPRRQRVRTYLPDTLPVVFICAITALICLPGIVRFTGVSLFDEMTHFDYAYKIAYENRVPRSIEPLADATLQEWACRPTEWQPDESLCQLAHVGQAEPGMFPADGANYNGFHPPLYYALTGWGARSIVALTSPITELSLFVAMRIMSTIWLAAGLSAFYGVLRLWTKRRSLSLAVTGMMLATPAIASFGMQINPDATAVLAGTAALYLAHRIYTNKPAFTHTLVLTFLVASTKLLAIVAILAVVTWALLTALARIRNHDRDTTKRWALPFLGAGLGTALSFITSELLTKMAGPATQDNPILGLSTQELHGPFVRPLIDTLGKNVDLVSSYWLPVELNSVALGTSARITGIILIATVGILIATHKTTDPRFHLGWATAAGALAVPLVIQVRQLLSNGEFFTGVAARYSITIIPLAFACVAVVLAQRSWGTRAAWVWTAISGLVIAVSIAGVLAV